MKPAAPPLGTGGDDEVCDDDVVDFEKASMVELTAAELDAQKQRRIHKKKIKKARVADAKDHSDLSGEVARCECKSERLDEFPCGCLLLAAEKAGAPWAGLLSEHDSVETWKDQYKDLPDYIVPGTEQLKEMEPDTFLLPPEAYPIPRGRQGTPVQETQAGFGREVFEKTKEG